MRTLLDRLGFGLLVGRAQPRASADGLRTWLTRALPLFGLALGLGTVLSVAVWSVWLAQAQAQADAGVDDLPIFDAHLHYNRDQWSVYSVDDVLGLMDQAGVRRAFVSSTPDDGTLMLRDRAPERIVPNLRPYRVVADQVSWTRDPSILDYLLDRLDGASYRGLGEFHLNPGEAGLDVPRGLFELGAARGLVLQAHTDATGLQELLRQRSDISVLWAHAGMNASPATVGRVLDAYPNVWVDLALRTDVAPNGRLDPAWAALFERYPDRFLIGTDTWVVSQWTRLPELMARTRGWLRQLPPEVAQQIAYANAERLLGS
jgi:Amidohydrolase